MEQLLTILYSLASGIVLGLVFGMFGLPIPAPGVFAGVVGVFGVFLGGWIVSHF